MKWFNIIVYGTICLVGMAFWYAVIAKFVKAFS